MNIPLIVSIAMGLGIVVMIICMIYLMRKLTQSRELIGTLTESVKELEDLNRALRVQRHDQLNHLQVVYGMLELDEYEEAKKYLKPVFKEMQKTAKALKTSIPALNALLMAKEREASAQGIDFYVEVRSDLKNIGIPSWELCKVLSNIIDNAITALEQKDGDRKLTVVIFENSSEFCFEIANNGPEIEKGLQKEIFKAGFSSKKETGHGFGLSIVKKVLEEANGRVELTSGNEETVFTVFLKK